MKKIGIVGGLGPASTVDYYNGIIENFRRVHGADVYPEIVIDSVNMHDLISAVERGDYDGVARQMTASIHNLERAGADFALIASNTPHIAFDRIQKGAHIPLISIVEATSDFIVGSHYKTVVVFGTKFTMRNGLYAGVLAQNGVTPVLPNDADIEAIGNLIYPNLENGIVIAEDKEKMIGLAERYIAQSSADALLLGCTEIPLMIKSGDVSVPVIDTVKVHIAAAEKML